MGYVVLQNHSCANGCLEKEVRDESGKDTQANGLVNENSSRKRGPVSLY